MNDYVGAEAEFNKLGGLHEGCSRTVNDHAGIVGPARGQKDHVGVSVDISDGPQGDRIPRDGIGDGCAGCFAAAEGASAVKGPDPDIIPVIGRACPGHPAFYAGKVGCSAKLNNRCI
jgi:hypothetical protein